MTNLSQAYKLLDGTVNLEEKNEIKKSIDNILIARLFLAVTILVFTILTIQLW